MHRCCLVGYGRAGKIHYRNIMANPSTSLIYVCDLEEGVESTRMSIDEEIVVTSNLEDILADKSVDMVVVCSPTNTHRDIVVMCLKSGKHVLCEKPLAESGGDIRECYESADENNRVLLCAYNRRFDPELLRIKDSIRSIGGIYRVITVSRDYPYPSYDYLRESSGVFHDCAVHDIDYVNWIVDDKPISIYVTGNVVTPFRQGAGKLDIVTILMEYSTGIIANINLSRISENYDQRVIFYGENGTLSMTNPYEDNTSPISFQERYHDSYVNELDHFIDVVEGKDTLRVTLQDCLNSQRIVEACDKSYASCARVTVKYSDGFRNYDDVAAAVKEQYRAARENQTVEYVERMRSKYLTFERKLQVSKVFRQLESFVDISDPDMGLPNYHHGVQTAEAIRKDGHPEWFQLVGLIHDIGKIMCRWGCDADGTSIKNQWGIVGDTFVVGCRIPDQIVFPEFNESSPDMKDARYKTANGMYEEGCGLDAVICSWGHDEYLYSVLKHNKVDLPEEALYVIRYHSLYLYHDKQQYEQFLNKKDKDMFHWLKLFSSYDLYTKCDDLSAADETREYYQNLVNKYLNGGEMMF